MPSHARPSTGTTAAHPAPKAPAKRPQKPSKRTSAASTTKPKLPSKPTKRIAADSSAPKRKPQSIDTYLDGVSDSQRSALENVRRTIRATAPAAEECISYGVAAFRLDGKVLVGFGATPRACVFYPMSGTTIAAHRKQLQRFKTTKGSIHFLPEEPLTPALIKLLTKARIAENQRR